MLVIDVPLMLGVVDEAIPLPGPMELVVRVEDPATEDSVESIPSYIEFVELDEGGESGKSVLTSTLKHCGLSINGALNAFVSDFPWVNWIDRMESS